MEKEIKYSGYAYIRPLMRGLCLGKEMEDLTDIIDEKLEGYYGDAEVEVNINIKYNNMLEDTIKNALKENIIDEETAEELLSDPKKAEEWLSKE